MKTHHPKNEGILEQTKSKAISELASTLNLYGLSPSESRLFGTIFLEGQALTLDEMGDMLGMSKTSMSNGIRSLLEASLVERVWKKGVRKDLYKANTDLNRNFYFGIIQSWEQHIAHHKNNLLSIKEEISHLTSETDDSSMIERMNNYIEKISNIIHFYEWLEENFQQFALEHEDD